MWRNLNLRARILIGYGVVLALAAVPTVFLMLQIGSLNRQIEQINTGSVAEAEAGTRLAARVADVRQAVDRYLRQPSPEARTTLEHSFTAAITAADHPRGVFETAAQHARHTAIVQSISEYRADTAELTALLIEQARLSEGVNLGVFDATALVSREIVSASSQQAGADRVAELSEAQQSLQQASRLLGTALSEQDQTVAEQALEQVRHAQALLQRSARRDAASDGLGTALTKSTAAITTARLLSENIRRVRFMYDEHLQLQANTLSDQADALAAGALADLTGATGTLRRQVVSTQQIAGLGLLATVAVAVLFALRLAHSLAWPLVRLADAVEHVNGGDYSAFVALRDGGEIGRLGTAFNHMALTLKRQRDEVGAQQAAMAERNRQLEALLGDLQAATDARDALTSAVQALSVPVIPILRQVIAVPLVGEIDAERAALLMTRVLDGVTAELARVVILDITGVPFVDGGLAGWLLKTAAAAELLGARCVLTGITPEVAQALVMSGADLGRLVTRTDMRAGVEFARAALR